MPNILIRDIDPKTLENLKKRAARNNHSLQAELKTLLEEHAGHDIEAVKNMINETIEAYKADNRTFSDSTEDIRMMRDR